MRMLRPKSDVCEPERQNDFRDAKPFVLILVNQIKRQNSLHSWRYCLGLRLKFWRRSRDPKKGVGTRSCSRGFRRSGPLRRQILLDYYTIPPASQAKDRIQLEWLLATSRAGVCNFVECFKIRFGM